MYIYLLEKISLVTYIHLPRYAIPYAIPYTSSIYFFSGITGKTT